MLPLQKLKYDIQYLMLKIDLSNRKWQWAILIFLAFIWGSSFILMKKGLQSYTNPQVAALRIFISFLILLPFIRKSIKRLNLENLKPILIVGFIGTGIPAFLFTKAQTQIDSSLAGILNALTPLFTFIIGLAFYKEKSSYRKIAGIFVGLAGAMGLIYKDSADTIGSINLFALFVIAATICYGISTNEVKTRLKTMDGMEITSLGFLVIGPWAGIYLLFTDFSYARSTEHPLLNLGFITLLALFSSVLALVIFNNLIKYTSALFSTSVTYIIPVFAILWGIIDGETITPIQFIWISAILLGVFLVKPRKSEK